MWDLSLAQPHFLHIPHSAWDTDCSLKKVLLQCWTSMCKIYHGGVRNFNLCFQNRLAAWGPKWGVSEIPHSFLLFFFLGWTLHWQDYPLHSGYSIFSPGYISPYVDVSCCVKIHGLGRGCQKCSSKCRLILGNSCVPVPTEGMPEKNWRRDGAQDYVGCNDHSSAHLFHGAKLWSLGPQHSMLGWTPLQSREEHHLCGYVFWELSRKYCTAKTTSCVFAISNNSILDSVNPKLPRSSPTEPDHVQQLLTTTYCSHTHQKVLVKYLCSLAVNILYHALSLC